MQTEILYNTFSLLKYFFFLLGTQFVGFSNSLCVIKHFSQQYFLQYRFKYIRLLANRSVIYIPDRFE